MNQFYIPEIGDSITLAEDWTFELQHEYRNDSLANLLGYYNSDYGWVSFVALPILRSPDYTITYPNESDFKSIFNRNWYDKYKDACNQAAQDCIEYVKYQKDFQSWRKECERLGVSTISVKIPAGTILIVDRIYIRKGLKDYSSITFRTSSLGVVPAIQTDYEYTPQKKRKEKKTQRFWVSLKQANKIKNMVTQENMLDFYQDQPTQHYKKFGNFQFEIAETEHQVVTQLATDTVPETTKTAQVGDFILIGTQGERYVLKPGTFEKRYLILEYCEETNRGTAKATGECDAFEYEGEDFVFESPWNDTMICNEGDFLVINLEKPEIYRIQRQAFFDTYEPAVVLKSDIVEKICLEKGIEVKSV